MSNLGRGGSEQKNFIITFKCAVFDIKPRYNHYIYFQHKFQVEGDVAPPTIVVVRKLESFC